MPYGTHLGGGEEERRTYNWHLRHIASTKLPKTHSREHVLAIHEQNKHVLLNHCQLAFVSKYRMLTRQFGDWTYS